ncbi:MAG: hypothetical protein EOO71_35260, partial [Myxococcaceae bacterium]
MMFLAGLMGWGLVQAGGLPVGLHGYSRYQSASPPRLARDSDGGTVGGAVLGSYLAFIQEQRAGLKKPEVKETERQAGHAALNDLLIWAIARTEEQLAEDSPLEVYLRMKVSHAEQDRAETVRVKQVKAKLEEYHRWANARGRALAEAHFRRLGTDGLLTESALYEATQRALVEAVLDWAYAHTLDPDFVRKSPSEVALYLLARDSLLASAVEAGRLAPPTWDPRKEPPGIPPEEVVLEMAVGLLPIAGEAVDLKGVVLGESLL